MNKIPTLLLSLLTVGVLQEASAQALQNNALLQIGTGATLHVQGDFTNANVAASDFRNSGTFSITGDFINDKTLSTTYALGKTVFSGTTPQTLSSSALYTTDLEINNAAGLTLGTGIFLLGTATFTNGIIVSPGGGSSFIFATTAATFTGAKDASHVNGFVTYTSGITGAISFPVGNGTKFQQLNLNKTSAGTVRARYFGANAGTANFATTGSKTTPLLGYNTGEYWEVTPTAAALTGSFTVFWDGTNDANAAIMPSIRRVARKVGTSGTDWFNEGGYGTGTVTAGSVTSNSITVPIGAVQIIALGWEDQVLPLSWINVNATDTKDQKVQVQWQVSESNVTTYIVERNTGAGFTEIATLASKGNGNNVYSITDTDRNSGSVYYRIKQIGQDGTLSYSDVFDVRIAALGKLSVFPNPVVNQLSVDSDKVQDAKIFNVQGQQVKTIKLQAGRTTVELRDLTSGIYFLRTADGTVTKLIKADK